MKNCTLKNKPCRYVKDKGDYRVLQNKIICNLQAMEDVEGGFEINKMKKCPLDKKEG